MQLSFSLNDFGVQPSVSNRGDGVSEVVLWLSHQRGKKPRKNKIKLHRTTTTKKPHKGSQVQVRYSFCKVFSMQV
jgi:hypothetical protein